MSGALSTFNPNLFSPLIPTTQPTAAPLPPVSPTVTPSPLASAAQAQAIRTLENIMRSEDTSPPGAPAPNVGGFTASRGLGQLGGMVGGLAAGPLGGAFGRSVGAGLGAVADATRANDIAAALGLGPVADVPGAFGQAAGRSAAQAAASMGVGALASLAGVPSMGLGSLAGRAASGLFGSPSFGTDIGTAIANHVTNRADLQTALDREDMALGMNMRANALTAEPRSNYGSDMDFGHVSGLNPSTAASDYYDSGMAGMDASAADFGGGGYGGPGDNASAGYGGSDNWAAGGYIKPKNYANGGVVALEGGGKIAIGPGGGLDDLIPTSINGRRAAALSDGEFVIPADVVSMFGDGSSNAGARRLYDLVRQVRETKTGRSEQAGPLPVGEILKRSLR